MPFPSPTHTRLVPLTLPIPLRASLARGAHADYKDAFDYLRGKNEQAQMADLADALRALGLVLTEEDVTAAKAAAGGGDTFNFEQFVEAIKKVSGHPQFSAKALTAAFMQLDRKGNGYITEKDLKYILGNKLVEPLTDAEISAFLNGVSKKVSKESNGYNYSDIVDVVTQLPPF